MVMLLGWIERGLEPEEVGQIAWGSTGRSTTFYRNGRSREPHGSSKPSPLGNSGCTGYLRKEGKWSPARKLRPGPGTIVSQTRLLITG